MRETLAGFLPAADQQQKTGWEEGANVGLKTTSGPWVPRIWLVFQVRMKYGISKNNT